MSTIWSLEKRGAERGVPAKVETGSKRSNEQNFQWILPLDANIDLKSGAPLSAPFFPTTILSKYEARGITGIKNGLHSAHGSDYTVRWLRLQEITISCNLISILTPPQMSKNQSIFVYRYEFHYTKTRNYCMDKLFWPTKRYAYTWLENWVPEKGGRKGGAWFEVNIGI